MPPLLGTLKSPAARRAGRRGRRPGRDRQGPASESSRRRGEPGPVRGLLARSVDRRSGTARSRPRRRWRTARRSPPCSTAAESRRVAVRGRRWPWPRCPTSAPCRSTSAAWPTRAPTCARPRPPRSPRSATRRPRCSNSSPRRNELPPRSCPSSAPSTPASGRSPTGASSARSRSPRPPGIDAGEADRPDGQLRRGRRHAASTWRTVKPVDAQGQVDLGRTYSHDDDLAAYGYAEIQSPVGPARADGRRAPTTR